MLEPSAKPFGCVVIGVGDMSTALDLRVGQFDMQLVRRSAGDDATLAAIRGLPAGSIADQAPSRHSGACARSWAGGAWTSSKVERRKRPC